MLLERIETNVIIGLTVFLHVVILTVDDKAKPPRHIARLLSVVNFYQLCYPIVAKLIPHAMPSKSQRGGAGMPLQRQPWQ